MRVIVIGNEKGGAGKSTVAVHLAVALMHDGARLAMLDLDRRQQSMAHFFSNRARWAEANGAVLPHPQRLPEVGDADSLDEAIKAANEADFLVIDTPGADTELARLAHQ